MNSKIVDLHGLIESEAILEIDSALLDLESDYYLDSIEFITGKGTVMPGLVMDAVNDYHDFSWDYKDNNSGCIIIYKEN